LLANARFGTPAKTTDYYATDYYSQTEIACLSQRDFKNCRLTECPGTDCGINNFFLQTDFTCCPQTHHYGYGQEHQIGTVGFSDRVGTCDWDVSIYREGNTINNDGNPDPILTDDTTAEKYGTVWGTCYLNANAEHCDSPLCERMAISVQGGLYRADAYSTEAANSTWAETDTSCTTFQGARSLIDIFNELETFSNLPNSRSVLAAAKAKLADYEAKSDPLYEGRAWIISGTFYETSKHDGSKIEESGLFEFALQFDINRATSIGTEPTRAIPIVRSKTAKMRFTREKEGYYGHEGHERRRR